MGSSMVGKKRERTASVSSSKKNGPASSEEDRLIRENRALRRELAACRKECRGVEKRVGQFLHDGVCQDLSAVALYLQSLKTQLSRNNADLVSKALQLLSESVKRAVDSTHALSADLRRE